MSDEQPTATRPELVTYDMREEVRLARIEMQSERANLGRTRPGAPITVMQQLPADPGARITVFETVTDYEYEYEYEYDIAYTDAGQVSVPRRVRRVRPSYPTGTKRSPAPTPADASGGGDE